MSLNSQELYLALIFVFVVAANILHSSCQTKVSNYQYHTNYSYQQQQKISTHAKVMYLLMRLHIYCTLKPSNVTGGLPRLKPRGSTATLGDRSSKSKHSTRFLSPVLDDTHICTNTSEGLTFPAQHSHKAKHIKPHGSRFRSCMFAGDLVSSFSFPIFFLPLLLCLLFLPH